ncbi:collagen alpha-1(I) chain-like [Monodon monoceros]|uniref:collagen alpha-1(I) chain-like n=1 Tax=Monodon monoceros TaxID=40151 RepID=UPI0010F456AD|nr:collagen alpha-1(I) chain-like [Monodon monoceros]
MPAGAPRGPRQRNGAHGSAEPGFHGPAGPRHAALRTAPAGPPRAGPLAPLWPSVRGTGLRPALLDTPGPEGRPATCRATRDTGPGTRLGGQDAASVTGSPAPRAGPRIPDPARRTRTRSPRKRRRSGVRNGRSAWPLLTGQLCSAARNRRGLRARSRTPRGGPRHQAAPRRRRQGARASSAGQPGRCGPAALRRLPPAQCPGRPAWYLYPQALCPGRPARYLDRQARYPDRSAWYPDRPARCPDRQAWYPTSSFSIAWGPGGNANSPSP